MLKALAVLNYRTLRDFVVPLEPLNLITGPNGSGKSNVYKALRLLAETAQGGVVASLAREGGLSSTLWAGPENGANGMRKRGQPVQGTKRKSPVSLGLGFVGDEFSYSIDLGLPAWDPDVPSAFSLDPEVKGEYVWAGHSPRPSAMLVERRNAFLKTRTDSGDWETVNEHLSKFDSMLFRSADPRRTPELLTLRDQILSWRFYDHFRSDAAAPARLPQIGTYTPVLGHDGSDVAAALQTIREIGDPDALDEAVSDAFPGARVEVEVNSDGYFQVVMHQEGLLRPLKAGELSDGTLRYLLWIAALLSPRPPSLLVLNEPETSLHPDLLAPLGRLISRAAANSQVIVVSHASRLIVALEEQGCQSLSLDKIDGETTVIGQDMSSKPTWSWIAR